MLKVWRWYQKCLTEHPVKTQVISSGVIWGLGDIAAQSVTHATALHQKPNLISDRDKELHINWRRVANTSLFGMAFVGPVGHFWRYRFVLNIVLLLLAAWMTILIFNSMLIVVPVSIRRALFNAVPLLLITHGTKMQWQETY